MKKPNKLQLIIINGKEYTFVETDKAKLVRGPDYNLMFNKADGQMLRWGVNKEDDPIFSPIGPEILDIEIAKNGCPNKCAWCYKSNTNDAPTNMSLDTFKQIISLFPLVLTQIAIGTTGAKTNPDLIKMMAWCREIGIIPNITVSGIDMDRTIGEQMAEHLGAIAISVYPGHKEEAYNTIEMMSKRYCMNQVNIHIFTAMETMGFVNTVIDEIKTDSRLSRLNAVVFLGVKPKGRAVGNYTPIDIATCKEIINKCMVYKLNYGFDSCGARRFEKAVESMDIDEIVKQSFRQASEPCESALFSFYVDVNGMAWYCSFAENHEDVIPVNMLDVKDFYRDVWYATPVKAFRAKVMASNRACPIYKLD